MRYFLGLLALTACSGDPGTITITAEPAPVEATPAPAPTFTAEKPPTEPVEPPLQEAPPEQLPAGPPAGFHEHPSGACYLPDVLKAGDCKCAVRAPGGNILVPGTVCFDSCRYNENGIPETHAFCVDGGLSADRRL